MTPWEILGWMIVAVIGLILAIIAFGLLAGIYSFLSKWMRKQVLYLKTRNVAPAKGQRWNQEGSTLTVTDVYDNGRIGIRIGNTSWSDTPETWKNRVRNRKLYLINP